MSVPHQPPHWGRHRSGTLPPDASGITYAVVHPFRGSYLAIIRVRYPILAREYGLRTAPLAPGRPTVLVGSVPRTAGKRLVRNAYEVYTQYVTNREELMTFLTSAFRGGRPSESDVFHLLSNDRRRETLTALWRRPSELTLRDLSEQIAATEAGVSPAPRPVRDSVYNALHQTHLPTLDRAGYVEYDADRKVVRPSPASRKLGRYMDTVSPVGLSWGEYYRGIGITGLCGVVGSLASVPGFAAVDPLVFASGTLALFATSTCYQLVSGPRSRLAGLLSSLR